MSNGEVYVYIAIGFVIGFIASNVSMRRSIRQSKKVNDHIRTLINNFNKRDD